MGKLTQSTESTMNVSGARRQYVEPMNWFPMLSGLNIITVLLNLKRDAVIEYYLLHITPHSGASDKVLHCLLAECSIKMNKHEKIPHNFP